MGRVLLFGFVALLFACDRPQEVQGTNDISVGKRTYAWFDKSRFDPEYGGYRVINVQVWYPIEPVTAARGTSSYIPGIGEVWEQLDNWSASDVKLVSSITTSSVSDQHIKRGSSKFPVLFFSPSLGGHASYYTYYAERLAQSGYAVVGISHAHESEFVIDELGEVIPLNLSFHDSLETLKIPEDVTGDQFRALKSQRTKVLGEDIVFCISQMKKRNFPDFENKIDFARIGCWGHSVGGAAAIYASTIDPRIKAVVDMDGTPPSHALTQGIHVPFMFLEDLTDYRNHDGYKIQFDRRSDFCAKGSTPAYRVLFEDIQHTSFSDIRYYTAERTSQKEAERKNLDGFLRYMVQFFDASLNGNEVELEPVFSDSLEVYVFENSNLEIQTSRIEN